MRSTVTGALATAAAVSLVAGGASASQTPASAHLPTRLAEPAGMTLTEMMARFHGGRPTVPAAARPAGSKEASAGKAGQRRAGDLRLAGGARWPKDSKLLAALRATSADLGRPLRIISGLRTRREQAVLYQRYLNGGNLAARPGTSDHEKTGPGKAAADVYVELPSGERACLGTYRGGEGFRAGRRHGLVWSASGECWHVSAGKQDANWRP